MSEGIDMRESWYVIVHVIRVETAGGEEDKQSDRQHTLCNANNETD